MPKADPFAQLRLLELAALDKSLSGAAHRRATLPEIADIAAAQVRLTALTSTKVVAETDVSDLDKIGRKLDSEIDQVRGRAERDSQRLASGAGGAKDLENLQHEITSLARRQGVLEDEALELMEKREAADAALAAIDKEFDTDTAAISAAETRRDATFAEVDEEVGLLTEKRNALTASLPADLVAVYERIHRSGKVAAAELTGSRCEACRIDLDRVEVSAVRAAPRDEVIRCSECGAILIRS